MDKNYDNNLNGWLSAILGLNAIFGVISVVSSIWQLFSEDNSVNRQNELLDIVIGIIFVYGCVKLFFASRIGFYAIVIACLLNVIVGGFYIQSQGEDNAFVQQLLQTNAFKVMWMNVGKIVFIMLLMLLRDKGKNAYQVLWGK